MTDAEKLKALLKAVDHTLDNWLEPKPLRLVAARAAYDPPKQYEYGPLPEWGNMTQPYIDWVNYNHIKPAQFDHLRELTKREVKPDR